MSCRLYFENQHFVTGKSFLYIKNINKERGNLHKIFLFEDPLKNVEDTDIINIVTLNGEIELLGNDYSIEKHSNFTIIYMGKSRYIDYKTGGLLNDFHIFIESKKCYFASKDILIKAPSNINIPNSSIIVSEDNNNWIKVVFGNQKTNMFIQGMIE
jgi:hypothetical protein